MQNILVIQRMKTKKKIFERKNARRKEKKKILNYKATSFIIRTLYYIWQLFCLLFLSSKIKFLGFNFEEENRARKNIGFFKIINNKRKTSNKIENYRKKCNILTNGFEFRERVFFSKKKNSGKIGKMCEREREKEWINEWMEERKKKEWKKKKGRKWKKGKYKERVKNRKKRERKKKERKRERDRDAIKWRINDERDKVITEKKVIKKIQLYPKISMVAYIKYTYNK